MRKCKRCGYEGREFYGDTRSICKSCVKLLGKAKRAEARRRVPFRKCLGSWCGKTYKPQRSTSRYCSEFCRRKAKAETYKQKHAAQLASMALALRKEVIAAYGNRCACCDESHFEFLTIDHINGGGQQERARGRFYHSLKARGFPKEEYRCLCMNCNWAIRRGDTCPHQTEKQIVNHEVLDDMGSIPVHSELVIHICEPCS